MTVYTESLGPAYEWEIGQGGDSALLLTQCLDVEGSNTNTEMYSL